MINFLPPTPNREPIPLACVTSELGVLLGEIKGRKGCPLVEEEKPRISLLLLLCKGFTVDMADHSEAEFPEESRHCCLDISLLQND